MANFPRVWASGIGDDVEISGSELTTLDENISKAPNLSEGSEHSPTSPVVLHGWALHLDTDGELRNDGLIDVGGELRLSSGGVLEAYSSIIRLNEGAALNALENSFVQLFYGSVFRAYSGSVCDFEGEATVDGSFTFGTGSSLALNGTVYPQLFAGDGTSPRAAWLPCRGQISFGDPSLWTDNNGASWVYSQNTAGKLYLRVPVLQHLTVDMVQIWWRGPAHSTWPPANRAMFSVYKVSGTAGGRTILKSASDTTTQGTYEDPHGFLVSLDTPTSFDTNEYMLLEMTTESGVNALGGSAFYMAEMGVVFSELKGF